MGKRLSAAYAEVLSKDSVCEKLSATRIEATRMESYAANGGALKRRHAEENYVFNITKALQSVFKNASNTECYDHSYKRPKAILILNLTHLLIRGSVNPSSKLNDKKHNKVNYHCRK